MKKYTEAMVGGITGTLCGLLYRWAENPYLYIFVAILNGLLIFFAIAFFTKRRIDKEELIEKWLKYKNEYCKTSLVVDTQGISPLEDYKIFLKIKFNKKERLLLRQYGYISFDDKYSFEIKYYPVTGKEEWHLKLDDNATEDR
jgi:hypothetical protein